ncbi:MULTISPECIES: hypothetical protein [Fischerella]|uniref:Cytokinin dehydrogenase 1 FAD/cytokinin binding domain-containing protein n=1 Tax=Fischerella muscicola CCMEE 5323 TaxID=2019572 RepID=A0A2N6JZT3_FISMU|nr:MULTISPECIES: hypothetical protein [Fischerella]MBD2430075.1 hypothetical protein [Fischerella sp. FACHB-380]PLZ87007.1 hypothetical protein CEN44_18605 [Fischerella muscicola CCMEE 5323]
MKNNTSRRVVLQGVIATTIVIGFDPANRVWVTSASASSLFESLPPLDGVLYTDNASLATVADDFGHIVHRQAIAALTRDQRLLINDERFDYVKGQLVANDNGGWGYLLEAASFYTPPAVPNNNVLLTRLNYIRGTEQIEDKSYFNFLNRLAPVVATLKSIGVWSYPHPWLNLFVPSSVVENFVSEVASNLTLADTGQGPILLYPVKTNCFQRPLFRVPTEEAIFLFAILRTAAPPEDTVVRQMLTDNRRLFERDRDLGGYQYPVGAISFDSKDWRQHFRPVWGKLVSAKRRYDPDNLLTPGQGIF